MSRDSGQGIDTTNNWDLDEEPEETLFSETIGLTVIASIYFASKAIKNAFLYLPRKAIEGIGNIYSEITGIQ